MQKEKNNFSILSYQINPYVLKSLKKLELSIDEILLFIYFTNVKMSLDLEDIISRVSLNEEEILNAYSSLIKKGLLEIKTKKISGKITEEILLDNFYNKMILDMPKKEINTDIYAKFENEFGRSLSPVEYETITSWINNGTSEEVIVNALKEAVINGVCTLRYVDKIIYDWSKKNISGESKEYKELFDYNWLEDDYE